MALDEGERVPVQDGDAVLLGPRALVLPLAAQPDSGTGGDGSQEIHVFNSNKFYLTGSSIRREVGTACQGKSGIEC